jgi:hypothetical protein
VPIYCDQKPFGFSIFVQGVPGAFGDPFVYNGFPLKKLYSGQLGIPKDVYAMHYEMNLGNGACVC